MTPSDRDFARGGSEGLLGSGNTVWDPDGEYFDKVVIAEIYGSVWLGVITFCSVQLSVKQWKDFVSKKYFLRIKNATFSCQKKENLFHLQS